MELKFKGTPGPWKQYKKDRLRIYGADDSDVAEVLLDDDATLIAAAPELLEALKSLVDIIECNPEFLKIEGVWGCLEEGKASIGKALGE